MFHASFVLAATSRSFCI